MYELIVVGGGPGGVAAGVYANASRYTAARILTPLRFSISATGLRLAEVASATQAGNFRFPTPSPSINSRLNSEN